MGAGRNQDKQKNIYENKALGKAMKAILSMKILKPI